MPRCIVTGTTSMDSKCAFTVSRLSGHTKDSIAACVAGRYHPVGIIKY
jgi:hypothetical protein